MSQQWDGPGHHSGATGSGSVGGSLDAAVARQRRLWERQAPRYDREMRFFERVLFGDARAWACGQAGGRVLEVAVGTGRNLPFYPHRVLRPGGLLVLADHVASTSRGWLAFQRLFEKLTLRLAGDHQTRRPLPLVTAAGFWIERQQRFKKGIVERLAARKQPPPAEPPAGHTDLA